MKVNSDKFAGGIAFLNSFKLPGFFLCEALMNFPHNSRCNLHRSFEVKPSEREGARAYRINNRRILRPAKLKCVESHNGGATAR